MRPHRRPKLKPKPKKHTTALARRPTKAPVTKQAKAELVPPTPAIETKASLERLTDEPLVLSYGVVKFTAEEEAILDEPVPVDEVCLKPTGQPYLSHPSYVRWFNRAFGRGQWGLQQLAKPQRADATILIHYALVVRQVPLFSCYGAAEYHENNKDQNYDDVIESTHAYALRRFAKRLGVGLELWDKRWLTDWMARHAVRVWLEGKDKPAFRRREDPPFWNEVQKGRSNGSSAPPPRRAQATAERPAATNPKADQPITTQQVTRFWTIARRAGRSDEEVKAFLRTHYHLESSRAILRKDYESICASVEHPGLLLPVLDAEREPGSDDQ